MTPEDLIGLVQSLRSPTGVAALLDVSGGIIHVNRPIQEYERTKATTYSTMTDEGDEIVQIIMHERLHFLQTCTFGFMYAYARDMFLHIMSILAAGPAGFDLPETIEPKQLSRLRDLLQRPNRKGTSGLSARAIIESLTMYQQVLIRIGMTPDQYADTLEFLGPGSYDPFAQAIDHFTIADEYRAAYLQALEILGDSTFYLFPYAACLSLCTAWPGDSFIPFCKFLVETKRREEAGEAPGKTPLSNFGWMGNALEKGEAAEGYESLPQHPVFWPIVLKLSEEAMKVQARPDPMALVEMLLRIGSTVVFYGDAKEKPSVVRIGEPVTSKDSDMALVLSALAQRVIQLVGPPEEF